MTSPICLTVPKTEEDNLVVESMVSQCSNILSPRDTDVVLGRGRKLENRPGNRIFTRTIFEFVEEYRKSSGRREKKQVTMKVFERARERGIRFLRKDFQEADYETIRIRIGQSLRYFMKQEEADKLKQAPHRKSNNNQYIEKEDVAVGNLSHLMSPSVLDNRNGTNAANQLPVDSSPRYSVSPCRMDEIRHLPGNLAVKQPMMPATSPSTDDTQELFPNMASSNTAILQKAINERDLPISRSSEFQSAGIAPAHGTSNEEDDIMNLKLRDLANIYGHDPWHFASLWSNALEKIVSRGSLAQRERATPHTTPRVNNHSLTSQDQFSAEILLALKHSGIVSLFQTGD